MFICNRNGIQQRRNSYEDGVYGTTCPIPPGKNFTYTLQVKDQIGSFFYFPSLAFHKAAGGFGSIKILSRPRIPVPFPDPTDDYTLLIGDWYQIDHTVTTTHSISIFPYFMELFFLLHFINMSFYEFQRLRKVLDFGHRLPFPQAVLINGRANGTTFTVEQGLSLNIIS